MNANVALKREVNNVINKLLNNLLYSVYNTISDSFQLNTHATRMNSKRSTEIIYQYNTAFFYLITSTGIKAYCERI